jgi:hypothetical protein
MNALSLLFFFILLSSCCPPCKPKHTKEIIDNTKTSSTNNNTKNNNTNNKAKTKESSRDRFESNFSHYDAKTREAIYIMMQKILENGISYIDYKWINYDNNEYETTVYPAFKKESFNCRKFEIKSDNKIQSVVGIGCRGHDGWYININK